MNKLEWILFSRVFYQFYFSAKKYGFYMEELDRMEKSILEMKP